MATPDNDAEMLHLHREERELARMGLIARIESRMKLLGLNPFSAAKKAGLGGDYVRDIIRGRVANPSMGRLAKLAEALQCSLPYLLGQQEPGPPVDPAMAEAMKDDPRLGEVQVFERRVPIPEAPAMAGEGAPMFYLPIRYELFTEFFRKSTEVERQLGYEAASIVPAYRDRDQWFEIVGDDSASQIAPRGSLLQIAKYTDDDRHLLFEGDFVIIEKHFVAHDVSYYLIERSVRQINRRYPDLGLWFFEYADHGDYGISDDIFRSERDEGKEEMTEQEIVEQLRDLGPVTVREGEKPEFTIDTPEKMARFILQQRKLRPRIMGKVLRALIPVDPRADFGIGPKNSGRPPK